MQCIRCKLEKTNLGQYCKSCRKDIDAKFYLANKDKILARKKIEGRKRYVDIKSKIDAIKEASPCKDCGKFWKACQMQFDHLSDKLYNVSEMISGYSWSKIEVEIAKCELVCANCHFLRTENRR